MKPTVTKLSTQSYNERPSIELKISSSSVKITNAIVVDLVSQPLYSISSDSKSPKLLSHKDNTVVATIDWEHQSTHGFPWEKHKCHKLAAVCWT
jgi:hypothetical protein